MSRPLTTTVLIEGDVDEVRLAEYGPGYQTVQLGPHVTLLIDKAAGAALLRAIGAAFDQAADNVDQSGIVALNTPAQPAVDATVHTMRVPDYGTGAA